MSLLFLIFLIIPISPLAGYLIDGYKQKNIRKGILYILGFFGFLTAGTILVNLFGLYFAFSVPILLFSLVLIRCRW